jgi:hypothetical protein
MTGIESSSFDFDSTYKVEGWRGIAWYAWRYETIRDEDYEWSGIEYENKDRVECCMVGDDTVHIFDISELTKLEEDEYCPECGQIGCKAYDLS